MSPGIGGVVMDPVVPVGFSSLLLITLYVYSRILNIREISKLKIVAAVLFAVGMSIPLTLVPVLYELLFLASVLVFVAITARVKTSLMISAVLISTGISLAIDLLALTLVLLVHMIVDFVHLFSALSSGMLSPESFVPEDYASVVNMNPLVGRGLIIAISVALTYLFFSRKRVKKGFVFLENKDARRVGLVFCIVIMIIRSSMGNLESMTYGVIEYGLFALLFMLLINICTVGIFLWWRHQTKVHYQQTERERVLREQDKRLAAAELQIQQLTESNNVLSEAVHRDNKLVPALYHAVDSFMSEVVSGLDDDQKARAAVIKSDLEETIRERKKMILRADNSNCSLPSSGIKGLDSILAYMFLRARDKGVSLELDTIQDVETLARLVDLLEQAIEKLDLETLLADLLENAIIATANSQVRKVEVSIGVEGDHVALTVSDSGVPFEKETLAGLGLQKATTHADEGGSGMGYLTIFKILEKSRASLTLTEYAPGSAHEHAPVSAVEHIQEPGGHTKSIKISFDNKHVFRIDTYRADELRPLTKRKDLLVHSQM